LKPTSLGEVALVGVRLNLEIEEVGFKIVPLMVLEAILSAGPILGRGYGRQRRLGGGWKPRGGPLEQRP
jgi:hypothetical protein